MKITLQALVERADGTHESIVLHVMERDGAAAPSAGLGLFVIETPEFCAALQELAIREQVGELVVAMQRRDADRVELGLNARCRRLARLP